MLAEAPGPLNFTMFLSLFSDKLGGKPINQNQLINNTKSSFDF